MNERWSLAWVNRDTGAEGVCVGVYPSREQADTAARFCNGLTEGNRRLWWPIERREEKNEQATHDRAGERD